MKTLIELYDERPLENVLAPEVFRPETVIYLCPKEIAENRRHQEKLRSFLAGRGVRAKLLFWEASPYDTDLLCRQLRSAYAQYEDCAVDVTGGSDAALFATGMLCAESGLPAFTYSRRRQRFYNIKNAEFADAAPCNVRYSVDDCFRMAGGSARMGRVDNSVLHLYKDDLNGFFNLFLKYRTRWKTTVSYMQAASQCARDTVPSCAVSAPRFVKGERGGYISPDEDLLRGLEELGFLQNLKLEKERVSFRFRDLQIRTWLRDIGSVLELFVWKSCLDTGVFQEVRTSVIVDWEGAHIHDGVSNEIDVVAVRGISPVFISCKTCDVDTDALNELAILRDRFGGAMSKAVIVTTERCQAVTRHRAWELGIEVIDLDSIRNVRSCLERLLG